jgi:threonine dehydratase
METFAEGLATRIPFALTMSILRERLDEMILVDDDDLRAGIRRLLHDDHVLAEGAAAAGVAAALQLCERLAGKTVVLVVSGGNLSLPKLRRVLADDAA